LGLFANGCSYRLGESGVTNESQLISEHHHKERAVEVLQALRRTIDEKALQRPFGGLWQLCAEAILRSGVRIDLFPKSARFIVSFAQTCSQVSWVDLPDMWDGSQCADAPHRRQSIEQLKAKLDDALRQLSHEVALGPREGYRTEKRNNIDELRLLGNGVYPATAERAFRTLLTRIEAK
jgi:hypothetical protein